MTLFCKLTLTSVGATSKPRRSHKVHLGVKFFTGEERDTRDSGGLAALRPAGAPAAGHISGDRQTNEQTNR